MLITQFLKNTAKLPIESLAGRIGLHRRRSAESRLWIMMYHRILPKHDARYSQEEPGMITEPDTFRLHLQILKQEFTIIPLSEWIDRKNQNLPLPEKACAITFDDGWLDNFEYALPVLVEEQVPMTLFAVSHMIGTCGQFWPNRILNLLQLAGDELGRIPWLHKLVGENPADSEISAQAIYSLKNYPDDQLLELIEQAEIDLSISPPTIPSLMSWTQLRELSANDLIEIGSHTCHHLRLTDGLNPDTRLREISESKIRLESELDKPVELFCYPNGDYCNVTVKEVAKHYKAAVTTERGINYAGVINPYVLHRIGVHQDISDNRRRLLARIANWP
ncbi:polysaccharide deacetylase family protein [Draconibacterium sp.]|nr:polysaccharide deacetylase family protein [Draconibacterium sp.]